MKLTKLILTGAFATAMVTSTFAGTEVIQDTSRVVENTLVENNISQNQLDKVVNDGEERKEIKVTELTPAIKDVLKTEPYVGWKIEKAFLIKEDDVRTYELHVEKKGENDILFFNQDGVQIEE